MLIRRGKRVADYLHADCLAVHVERDLPGRGSAAKPARETSVLSPATLHIETHVLKGKDVARTIVDFAREQNITQIFLGRAGDPGPCLGGGAVQYTG